jgi:hypothetical protein
MGFLTWLKPKKVVEYSEVSYNQYIKGIPDDDCEGCFHLMTEDGANEYYKVEELKLKLETHIKATYPSIKDLNIINRFREGYYFSWMSCQPVKMTINIGICWIDGVTSCVLHKLVTDTCASHFNDIPDFKNEHFTEGVALNWKIVLSRCYSEPVILQACRKYADCISKNLPLNMDNIHCLKIGQVSLYDLALGDLNNIEFVEELKD